MRIDYSIVVALLSGARNEKQVQLAQAIFNRMKNMFPDSKSPLVSASVLLANTYASSGYTEQASSIRDERLRKDEKKKVGLSWTVVDGKIFVTISSLSS